MDSKKEIGLLFGSFNPIHIGHLILAGYMHEMHQLDEIWLVVSPQNPFKETEELLDESHRLKMVQIAVGDISYIKVCDIEFTLSKPSYTYITLNKLVEENPQCRFSLIMGTDNIQSMHKWMKGDSIRSTFRIFVYPRIGSDFSERIEQSNIIYTNAPIVEVSSTFIRNQLKQGKSVDYILPQGVPQFINANKFYQ